MTNLDQSARWIRRFAAADDAETRLVCLAHAGGAASFYVPYAHALAPKIDVLAVQYPGRQDRWSDPMIDSVPGLADAIAEALRPWLDRPVAVFGHSMGASVAFEVAGRLAAAGTVPTRLFVSGRRAPSRYRDGTLHEMDDEALIAEMSSIAGTDPAVLADPELLAMVLPVLRNDFHAVDTYRGTTTPPLTCPITAMIGTEDPRVTRDDVAAWRDHTTAEFEMLTFPGGHFFHVDHQDEVLAVLSGR